MHFPLERLVFFLLLLLYLPFVISLAAYFNFHSLLSIKGTRRSCTSGNIARKTLDFCFPLLRKPKKKILNHTLRALPEVFPLSSTTLDSARTSLTL